MAGRSVSQAMTLSHRLSASPHPCASRLRRGPATGHPWPDAGRFGILPRPAPNRRGLMPTQAPMLGAVTGGTSKAQPKPKQHQKPSVTAFSPISPCVERARVRGKVAERIPTTVDSRFRGNDESIVQRDGAGSFALLRMTNESPAQGLGE